MSRRADLVGQRFGRLTVIEYVKSDLKGNAIWKCKCDCGQIRFNTTNTLHIGKVISCGCYRLEIIKEDLKDMKFGRLTVIEDIGRNKSRGIIWRCKCDCGNEANVSTHALKSGQVSCGCFQREMTGKAATIHGMSGSRLYKIWRDMKTRCDNPNTPYYHRYGGRGVSYSPEWNEFEPFKDWAVSNGYREDLTLDRINVDGNYEPSNCRWITNQEQQYNKRTSHYITYGGKTQTLTQWAVELGVKPKTLSCRINDYKWSIEKALTTPVERRKYGNKNQESVG